MNNTLKTFITEFITFGIKQANAAMFGGFLLAVMIVTQYWYPLEFLHRYDFIFLSAVAFQIFMFAARLETKREALVIIIFHIVATVMEIFKTSPSIGSWAYPEAFIFGIANVPLFTGFMYSTVGSYIARVWRIFDFQFNVYPKKVYTIILVAAIYINFFTHHYFYDIRWWLFLITIILFYKTNIYFKVSKIHRKMPLLFGWLLVSLFIWFAENIGTYVQVWIYPHQREAWSFVSLSKLSAWYLLMLLSFVLVTLVHRIKIKKIK